MSAVRLNSPRTLSSPRNGNALWFIHYLMVPKGCDVLASAVEDAGPGVETGGRTVALVPVIGYERAAELAQVALASGTTIREILAMQRDLSEPLISKAITRQLGTFDQIPNGSDAGISAADIR